MSDFIGYSRFGFKLTKKQAEIFKQYLDLAEQSAENGKFGIENPPSFIYPPKSLFEPGWYLRSAIPWIKRNGMPESTKDRPVIAIDQIFLLSKNQKYFYDYTAVMKIADGDTHARYARGRL